MFIPLICLAVGIFAGRVLGADAFLNVDRIIDIAIYVVILCAGIEVGCKKSVLRRVSRYGLKIFAIPLGTVIGTLAASILLGWILGYPMNESGSIGAGFAYYSLSSGLLSGMGAGDIAPLSFVSNIMREILAFGAIPLSARLFGRYAAVAPAGATSMDVTLGAISAVTDEEITVLAMINGILLTMLVPVMVPLIYQQF